MRTPARSLAVVTAALSAASGCYVEEPLATPQECAAGAWRSSIELADTWSNLGARVADDGVRVLAVWPERARDAPGLREVVRGALFDRDTGIVINADIAVLPEQAEVWSLAVVATARGFLVVIWLGDDGVRVQHVDDDGVVRNGDTLQLVGATFDDPVLADADGATLLTSGVQVTRVDAAGRLVSTTPPIPGAQFCSDAAAGEPGRLIAWCIAVDEETGTHGRTVVLDVGVDGTDPLVTAPGAAFPMSTGHLARDGEDIVAVFERGPAVEAAVLSTRGAVVAAPVVLARVVGDEQLLGEQVCNNTCVGLSLTATRRGQLLGFEVHDGTGFGDMRFASLTRREGVPTLVAGVEPVASAHAHAAAANADGPIVAWLQIGAESPIELMGPTLPAQHVVVQRRCEIDPE